MSTQLTSALDQPPLVGKRIRPIHYLSLTWLVLIISNLGLRDRWAPWIVAGMVPWHVWILGTAALGVLLWYRSERRVSIILIGVICFALAWLGSGITFLAEPTTKPTEPGVKVLQWNTEFWDTNEDSNTFADRLKRFNADIYVLQERGVPGPGGTIAGLDNLNDVHNWFPDFHVSAYHDLVTISRYPILEATHDTAGASLSTTIQSPNGPLQVVNVHTTAPYDLSFKPWTFSFWRAVIERDTAQNEQFTWLAHHAESTMATPTIVAGDFNVTAGMRNLDSRLPGLRDLSNTPWTGTWGVFGLDAWRLDWQLANERICESSFQVLPKNPSSDHAPTQFTIHLTADEASC